MSAAATSAASTLSERQRWHREQMPRAEMVRSLVGELVVMSAVQFANWAGSGALRLHAIDGREKLGKVPAGAWELLQWLAAVCSRLRHYPDGHRRHFQALQVPWAILRRYCGCSPDQIARVALPWLIERELVHREYTYQRVTKRVKGYRRDGSTGGSHQRACILMLGPAGEALLGSRAAAAAASRARAIMMRAEARSDRKNSDPTPSFPSYEGNDPYSIRSTVQSARARVEETPATPAPSTVQVEALRRAFPTELRAHRRFPGEGVGGQTRRRQNKNKPEGHEGRGGAVVGDHVVTPCQPAPVAQSAAIASATETPPVVASDVTEGKPCATPTPAAIAPPAAELQQPIAGAPVDVRQLLADCVQRLEADGARVPEPPPMSPATGRQGDLLGGNRTPAESAENERRRALAKLRAGDA